MNHWAIYLLLLLIYYQKISKLLECLAKGDGANLQRSQIGETLACANANQIMTVSPHPCQVPSDCPAGV